jgi:hypothetical protein
MYMHAIGFGGTSRFVWLLLVVSRFLNGRATHRLVQMLKARSDTTVSTVVMKSLKRPPHQWLIISCGRWGSALTRSAQE